jgi:hypothetical protein
MKERDREEKTGETLLPISIVVQQGATLYSFYSLQTVLYVSGDIFTHHQEHE